MKNSNSTAIRLWLSTLLAMWISVGMVHAAGKSCQGGFVVFAGQDAKGKVIFAMENTHSQGDALDWTLASSCAWLFDENLGWVKLKDRFGKPEAGQSGQMIGGGWNYQVTTGFQPKMNIRSDANNIVLNLKADRVTLQNKSRDGQLVLANGEGTLMWKGRKLQGRAFVRHELTMGLGATNIYFQQLKGVRREALYLNVGNKGFLNVYRTDSKVFAPLSGEVGLSVALDTLIGHTTDLQLEATAWARMGFYEFPTEWQGHFSIDGVEAMFKVSTFEAETTENYLFAGQRLAWARGFMSFDGNTYPIYGISEVVGSLEGRKEIEEAEWRARPAQEPTPGSSWEAIAH
jgi:hypothetical protein